MPPRPSRGDPSRGGRGTPPPRGRGDRGTPPPRGRGDRGTPPPRGRGDRGTPPPRGRGDRGTPPPRERGGTPQGGRGGPPAGQGTLQAGPVASAHVTATVGVRRPGYGKAGTGIKVSTNACQVTVPQGSVYHYDAFLIMLSISNFLYSRHYARQKLSSEGAGVYDGKKNLFMPHELDFGGGETTAARFDVPFRDDPSSTRPPKIYSIKVAKVAKINPEPVQYFVEGRQSQDEGVLTALMAMNVIIRQEPVSKYPFNVRSFFPGKERVSVGHGLELWRGYFQSIRPALDHVILNVDITTGMFFKPGPFINLALEFFGKTSSNPNILSPQSGLPDRERLRLQRFISGIRVKVPAADPRSQTKNRIIVVQRLSREGARNIRFTNRDNNETNVADYYRELNNNRPLQFPDVICALTASGAAFPLEKCEVVPGQIARKQVPPEITKSMVEFSQKRPEERLRAIRDGLNLLQHGQSDYVRNFGMSIRQSAFPMEIDARVIVPPRLMYGQGSKQPSVDPRNGQWNLMDKKFVQPQQINRWAVITFEPRFNVEIARQMVSDIIHAFSTTGMNVIEKNPVIHSANPQGGPANIVAALKKAGSECLRKNGGNLGPDLLVVVLPDLGNTEIYRVVKYFGDVEIGVATQCLKASKCRGAKIQYWANVALKINPKLGGINVKPDPRSAAALTDPHNPTIIMGADVMHPAPGATAPSHTALVANVDSDAAKYIADIHVQTSRQEIIADLGDMARYMDYRKNQEKRPNFQPKRLLFFRDGVSEGQYKQVKDQELAVLRNVCTEMRINPQITFIIVAKRHHFRFFPPTAGQIADRSGNCPAGTVVDTGITHPIEFDYYLQSHGGLLGTSRSAHYHVLHDDYGFTPDALQSLCYTLCHVFARATKSISIPAPVAYADLVCSRARNHYRNDLQSEMDSTRDGSSTELETMRADFRPIHQNQERRTFFT
ncbi:argonaute-like protein [Moniliophthora roreri MCA 2997]|uniref:Argonaute-like protein n=1 Tax=Moniliophthora roreri (strain MCA 2997) TaxID=1381753 RepID=V2XAR3_MONRO|nr:argonaute-like protein [Moniliophthora roreri MCA 2997]